MSLVKGRVGRHVVKRGQDDYCAGYVRQQENQQMGTSDRHQQLDQDMRTTLERVAATESGLSTA